MVLKKNNFTLDRKDNNDYATKLIVIDNIVSVHERVGKCNNCGECCKVEIRWQTITDEEWEQYQSTGKNGGYCFYYQRDKKRCRIYAHRPHICFTYPENEGQAKTCEDEPYKFETTTLGVIQCKTCNCKEN